MKCFPCCGKDRARVVFLVMSEGSLAARCTFLRGGCKCPLCIGLSRDCRGPATTRDKSPQWGPEGEVTLRLIRH